MPKGVTIQIKGLKELQARIGNIPLHVISKVDGEMQVAANDFVNRAVDDAPVDEGLLRNMITAKKNKVLDYEIVSGAGYSAYVEFGTKSRVQIPSDLTNLAAQFKGKNVESGDFYAFVLRILAWMKRNGISAGTYSVKTRRRQGNKKQKFEEDLQLATGIVYSILKRGIKAQPFFFKQRDPVYSALQKALGPTVKKALRTK